MLMPNNSGRRHVNTPLATPRRTLNPRRTVAFHQVVFNGIRNATPYLSKLKRGSTMADERNIAHDKKVASDKAKEAGGGVGEDTAANVDGDGKYTTETSPKHPDQPGKKSKQADETE